MNSNTERIEAVRTAVGAEKIELLTDIFRKSDSKLPGVRADRYRADHPDQLDLLGCLESDQLFLQRPQRNAGNYQVRVYALPLLEDARAQELVQFMDTIFTLFKSYYRERLSEPVTLSEISVALGAEAGSTVEASVKEALHYMSDGQSVWSSVTIGFPYAENSTITVSEAVLRYGDFTSMLIEFYDWHILKSESTTSTPSGNVFAKSSCAPNGNAMTLEDLIPEQYLSKEAKNTDAIIGFEDLLHPLIKDHALHHFHAGHWREAVLNAITAVFDLIRDRTGIDKDGAQLVAHTFSLDNPFLIFSEINSESGQNDQKGFLQILQGAYLGIRNPKAHSLAHDLDKMKAAQYLVFVSLLARRVSEAKPGLGQEDAQGRKNR